MTALQTTVKMETTIEYDTEKYNAAKLENAAKALQKSLKTHKVQVNEFIKQYFVENRNRLGKAIKELSGKYTPEVERAFTQMITYFNWQLPAQAQLDAYDAYVEGKGKGKEKEEKAHGLTAVLEFLQKKATSGRTDERQYYRVAYEAVKKSAEKEK